MFAHTHVPHILGIKPKTGLTLGGNLRRWLVYPVFFMVFSAPHTPISPTPYIIYSNFPSILHNSLIINTLLNQPPIILCFSCNYLIYCKLRYRHEKRTNIHHYTSVLCLGFPLSCLAIPHFL